jgi:hypothetical protein
LARITAQASRALDAVGAFIDADTDAPATRVAGLQQALNDINKSPGFAFTAAPGVVSATTRPRTGVYVMPDNVNFGSVEGILEECAQTSYPNLHQNAEAYLSAIDLALLTTEELALFNKGSNPQKARLGIIGSVLRPGAAIQNTIRYDRWIAPSTLKLPLIASLRAFLSELLDEPKV